MRDIYIGMSLSRLTRNGRAASLRQGNEMISSNDRMNHHAQAAIAAHLREKGSLSATARIGKLSEREPIYTAQNPCHIIVRVCPPTMRRMDAANWYPTVKPIIDGFTDMGLFEDDNNNVVTSIVFMGGEKSGGKDYRFDLIIRDGRLLEMEDLMKKCQT